LRELTRRIEPLERSIGTYRQQDEQCRRIEAIPGVGPLSSTAVLASVGDARTFRSGRQFAAFLGLVPRQSGTGGRVRLLGISKRGDPYLRTLLIHGARAVVNQNSRPGHTPPPWLRELLARRPKNVVIVALANKIARTIWALLAHGRTFDRRWGQAPSVSVA
jgi:transposase